MGRGSGGRGGAGGGRVGRPRATVSLGGIEYTKSDRATEVGRTLIPVSVAKLQDSLEPGTFETLVKGRAEDVSKFLETKAPLHAPRLERGPSGKLVIEDGRNRIKVLTEMGKRKIAISVPRGQAKRIRRELQ